MSIAGIYSNRGDNYQTLIAFDFALTILSEPEYQWLEIDSTTELVDDVIVGKSDGSFICCQCKKNQTDFKAWSITDLASELVKASSTLAANEQAKVHFYSRSDFGVVAKLREYSTLCGDEREYHKHLTKKNKKANTDLAELLAAQSLSLSTYEFLLRISFVTSPDFESMERLLHERLRGIASNSKAAYDAIWTCLDKLGGRMDSSNLATSSQHRLTKDDLNEILRLAGALPLPSVSISHVRTTFAETSAIGRSWHRDIGGQRISNPVVGDILAAIDAKKRAILLTGLPGSGKTCVMLDLQEELEQRAQFRTDFVPLFIQSREFADLATAEDRQAQGLAEQWVEQAALFAEDARVVVVLDSLDVLSIAREHSVLTYFLAQIDRLLLVPNVTVVTACREFDRNFDRRIAARQWDCEFECLPLNWDVDVAPLLGNLGIDLTSIDLPTRELIRNPRELELFVELAQRDGSFNVVTSHSLAQRYLDEVVQPDPELGLEAIGAIEAIADEMLKSRSLSIPRQRFSASQGILRRLQSLNLLQDTHDGKLMFGHQTLLDVLVISGAMRKGIKLHEFIQGLPPVPFVRPSIRSFVAQLARGERRELRKQLRAVLMGDAAFQIRRLIGQSIAQEPPQDGDWPLLRNLRDEHREVFQAIYSEASSKNWHQFWLKHLVPALIEMKDVDGLNAHIRRVQAWVNEDAQGVVDFWMNALDLDWLDSDSIADRLAFTLSDVKTENLHLVVPLLERLLKRPSPEHSPLGRVIARCIGVDAIDDTYLWRYIVGDIYDDVVVKYHFDSKLHCQPHEFGDRGANFLLQRMVKSTVLLDLAVQEVERWSEIKSAHYGGSRIGYRTGFLRDTSYYDAHSETDRQHVDSERILFDAIEAAILEHARRHSLWWRENRERLCFSHEGALCYLAILAITNSPQPNIELIGGLLCDRNLLEFDLSFELSALIREGFVYLDRTTQDAVMEIVQVIWDEHEADKKERLWVLKARAEYVAAIPCYLRSPESQAVLDAYEQTYGTFIREPSIEMRGGTVSAPFSFEVFLNVGDSGVVRLLAHYVGHPEDFNELLLGGEREVGWQLQQASSRDPLRFSKLLEANWTDLGADFRDSIMDGVVAHLAHRYGSLRPDDGWTPIDEPDGFILADRVLSELESHPHHWKLNRFAAKALEASAHIINDAKNARRIVLLAIPFVEFQEASNLHGDSVDLLTDGINKASGIAAESLMILTSKMLEYDIDSPGILSSTLRRFAEHEDPAIRTMVLRRLPYIKSRIPELGWELLRRATQPGVVHWPTVERCMYYSYRDEFRELTPLLESAKRGGDKQGIECWARISALSALVGHIDLSTLTNTLKELDVKEAWQGAASVWANTENIARYREQCLAGIDAGLKAGAQCATAVAERVRGIFREGIVPTPVPIEIIGLYFEALKIEDELHGAFGLHAWLNGISQRDPELALAATEIYLTYLSSDNQFFYDYENRLAQLMTRLFAEAEEREESDDGAMLKRVVAVQDSMLALGEGFIGDWLKAAERL